MTFTSIISLASKSTLVQKSLVSSGFKAVGTVSAVRSYSNGVFDKEEAAKENFYIYQKEKELIRKLRLDLLRKEKEALNFLEKNPKADPEFHSELKIMANSNSQFATGDALHKREAANEERYIRELEADKKKH